MLLLRYPIDKTFQDILEVAGQMDPQLAEIDKILDDECLFELFKTDLSQRYGKTLITGRLSTPVEVLLRMLTLKRVRCLSYADLLRDINESIVLRQFCRIYFNDIPTQSTLIRWAHVIQPSTLKQLNERVVELARQFKLTRGRKLRTDGTVVETNIHYPTDSSLLLDGVRVLSRYLQRAKPMLEGHPELDAKMFRNRTRSAKRQARQLDEQRRKRHHKPETQARIYRKLLSIARSSIRQAQSVLSALETLKHKSAKSLVTSLRLLIGQLERVIAQTVRRVLQQQQVPAHEKLVSLFEPHTDIICRGKAHKSTEFGHKVWLSEVDGGFISNYEILKGNPNDALQWQRALDAHVKQFGRAPQQASADRGVHSHSNETYAEQLEVKRVILPQPGYKSKARKAHENERSFRRGRHWHNGVEGRISVLKRGAGLRRCLDHGEDGFERWVGWGVITANLRMMGSKLAQAA